MITVCIFTLRDAMRTVQKSFNIPDYGTRHTKPDTTEEIQTLAELLRQHDLQRHIPNRPGNQFISPIDDLIHRGTEYAHTPKAYQAFRPPRHSATNMGHVEYDDVLVRSTQDGRDGDVQQGESDAREEIGGNARVDYGIGRNGLEGMEEGLVGQRDGVENDEAGSDDESEVVTREDLEVDEEERYDLEGEMVAQAMGLAFDLEEEMGEYAYGEMDHEEAGG